MADIVFPAIVASRAPKPNEVPLIPCESVKVMTVKFMPSATLQSVSEACFTVLQARISTSVITESNFAIC